MHLENIEINLKKLNTQYALADGASLHDIDAKQKSLTIKFPQQVLDFFHFSNGLTVNEPRLKIYEVTELVIENNKLVFALFDDVHQVGFDINQLNQANQWDIVNINTDFIITHTMASFWSNKIWAWLRTNRRVWEKEVF